MATVPQQQVLAAFASKILLLRPDTFDEAVYKELVDEVLSIVHIRHEMEQRGVEKVFVSYSIPVWEAIALHAGPFAPFAAHPDAHAKVLQLLGAAYPDAKDHRCFYQGIWLCGDGELEPGHLHVPCDRSSCQPPCVDPPHSLGSLNDVAEGFARCAERLASREFERDLARKLPPAVAVLQDTCRTLENCLKQSAFIVAHRQLQQSDVALDGELALRWNSTPTLGITSANPTTVAFEVNNHSPVSTAASSSVGVFTTSSLCCLLTRVVMMCYRTKETAELPKGINAVLTNLEWLRRPVKIVDDRTIGELVKAQNHSWTHGDLFSPMVELWNGLVRREPRMGLTCESALPKAREDAIKQWRALVRGAMSTTPATPSISFSQTVMNRIFERRGGSSSPAPENDLECEDAADGSAAEAESLTQRRCSNLIAKVGEDIPGEVRFDHKSATLRDTDSLVKFLRDYVRLPPVSHKHARLYRDMLFDRRKRTRSAEDGGETSSMEGRVFLPVVQSIEELFSSSSAAGGDVVLTPQERIVLGAATASV